jgi:ABC-type transport system involved in multi-copper enzyme maturation permease subunit
MKGLLLKDLLVLRQQSKIYLFMILMFAAFAIINEDPSFAGGMVAIVAVMLPITAMSYDERAGWDRLALSMPVSRKAMVLSKYLLGAGFSVVAFLISLLLGLKSNDPAGEPAGTAFATALVFWSVCIILFSVLMPLFIRLGVEKGRIVMMAVLFVPTGVLIFLSSTGIVQADPEGLERLLRMAPIAAIALFVASILISFRLYEKKEF